MNWKSESDAVGWEITVGVLAIAGFTVIWAILNVEVFPYLQGFQTQVYPVGVYDTNQLAFMGQYVFWTPVVVLFSVGFWMWNRGQQKTSAADLPG